MEKEKDPIMEFKKQEEEPDDAMIVFRETNGEWKRIKRENFEYGILARIRRKEIDAFDESLLKERERDILEKEGVILSEPEEIEAGGKGQKRTICRVLEQKS